MEQDKNRGKRAREKSSISAYRCRDTCFAHRNPIKTQKP